MTSNLAYEEVVGFLKTATSGFIPDDVRLRSAKDADEDPSSS